MSMVPELTATVEPEVMAMLLSTRSALLVATVPCAITVPPEVVMRKNEFRSRPFLRRR